MLGAQAVIDGAICSLSSTVALLDQVGVAFTR